MSGSNGEITIGIKEIGIKEIGIKEINNKKKVIDSNQCTEKILQRDPMCLENLKDLTPMRPEVNKMEGFGMNQTVETFNIF